MSEHHTQATQQYISHLLRFHEDNDKSPAAALSRKLHSWLCGTLSTRNLATFAAAFQSLRLNDESWRRNSEILQHLTAPHNKPDLPTRQRLPALLDAVSNVMSSIPGFETIYAPQSKPPPSRFR